MSTKTTLKRVALVAVSALGFGLMSIVPTSAARTVANTNNITGISVSTDVTPVAGANGTSAVHTVTFTSDTSTTITVSPAFKLTSKPATSAMDDAQTAYSSSAIALTVWQVSSAALTHDANTRTATGGTELALGGDLSLATANAAGFKTGKAYMHAYYDVPGTYVWTVWDDATDDNRVSGVDFSTTFTVVVTGAANTTSAVGTMSAVNSTSAVDGTDGSLVKVTLKDAAGNPVSPDQTSGVRIAVDGSAIIAKVNGTGTSGSPESYTLGAGDFNGSGIAFVNITNSEAETVVVSLVNAGLSAFTAPANINIAFKTITATATNTLTTGLADATYPDRASSTSYTWDGKAATLSFKTNTAAATYDKVKVTDNSSGTITGRASISYDLAVLGATTGTNKGSFSFTTAATSGSITLTVNAQTAITVSVAAAAAAAIEISSQDVIRSAAGATHSFTAVVEDQYGNGLANQTVTPTIAGRNSALVLANMITNASGEVTFTYKDASTSTTSLTDTITLTSGAYSDTASVTYTAAANLGVSSVLLTTPHTTSLGVTETVKTYSDINAGATGVQAGVISVSATVKDAAGSALAGVPVTFTVSGTTAAVRSDTKVSYTSALGVATAQVYGWAAGTYTVTATAGTVSDDAPVNFAQVTAGGAEARNIKATASGSTVTVTVTDRLGNGVYDAPLRATRTGVGAFAGSSTATGTTDRNGQAEFIISGGDAVVTVYVGSDESFGQTDALKGLVASTTATDIFTAYVAGDSVTAETGVGASFDAAGNNSATVSVTVVDSAQVAAEAASDAAAEAIDAANAATDAANLAAEAADAATVAAEEARDAADAATAAVEELATQVATLMAALKAQITTLANTVAKIAKKVKA